ncbi:MAG TPA: serine hydrolase [Intrasporangium sp.]|uniref:serine hydrolase domain-containing protein n=1 Tax=Intrasporangium sp. TaxID=1925024 RepID=UPI002D783398|nr:serine hydrolase [Intrasporangium sp.]HET7399796.1 serine hydrolase [Intrasporangium sp.]
MGADSGAARMRTVGAVALTSGLLLLAAGCSGEPLRDSAARTSSHCPTTEADRKALDAKLTAALTQQFEPIKDNLNNLRAVLIDVCGTRVHEEYRSASADESRNIASVTKSFVGTLVGIALADGSLKGLNQTLGELLPQYRGAMSTKVAGITLRQLLTMTGGLDADQSNATVGAWMESDRFVERILREGIVEAPGTFAYSSASSHLLSAILATATGRPVMDYAVEKLFGPLGIATRGATQPLLVPASEAAYNKASFSWPVDHQGFNFGGGWLKMRPQDMAKLGQLYLDNGTWKGHQVVPATWVHAATTGQVPAPGAFGGEEYGYQWWVTTAGGHPAYAAIGFGGQLVEVVPDKSVVAVFSTALDPEGIPRVDGHLYEVIVSTTIQGALP